MNKVPQQVKLNDTKTPVWQFKAHEQWVKTVLISDIVDPNDRVLELCCGRGLDIGKWQRAKISKLVGIDQLAELLADAKDRWHQKKDPFPAQFIECNVYNDSIDTVLPPDEEFDVVCCFNGLQYSFEDDEKARIFLANAASRLKPDGYFFGLLPDSSAIWYKAQSHQSGGKPAFKGDLYAIEFPSDEFTHFGTKYSMKLEGSPEELEYLVHFPSLIRLADEAGLQMLEIVNLHEFYEENKRNYGEQLKQLGVLNSQKKIEQNQKEIIALHTAFVFQKRKTV